MQDAAKLSFLRSHGYFAGLNDGELELVGRLAVARTVERGEIIQVDGEPAAALFLVVAGEVKIAKTSAEGKEQILEVDGPGDSFNDIPVLDDGPSLAGAQALSHVVLYEIGQSGFKTFLREHPRAARNAIGVLAGKVRRLVSLVEDLSFRHVIGRVARVLLQYAGDGAAPGQRLTQQEMAAMVGTAREVVGRSLKALEGEGLIRFDRHRIVVVNRQRLEDVAGTPV
jgi:CRP/FNR family transcriptional regulator